MRRRWPQLPWALPWARRTAQALETADVALLGNDLGKLAYAVRLAQRALRTVRFNIVLSIGIKLFFLVVVLLGYGSLWLAVLAVRNVGAALIVTLNGMRLLRWRVARESDAVWVGASLKGKPRRHEAHQGAQRNI